MVLTTLASMVCLLSSSTAIGIPDDLTEDFVSPDTCPEELEDSLFSSLLTSPIMSLGANKGTFILYEIREFLDQTTNHEITFCICG